VRGRRDRTGRRELETELDSGAGASTDVLLTEVELSFCKIRIVTLSFVFDKYYPIMN